MSLTAAKTNFSQHHFEEQQNHHNNNVFDSASLKQIMVTADVHHQEEELEVSDESDYHTSEDIELVELKPNGVLKYRDYEHVLKGETPFQEVINFDTTKNPFLKVTPPEETDETSSVNIYEALDSLDQVLYDGDDDHASNHSESMSYLSDTTSSLLSHSMISLSLSMSSDDTSSSQFSEATCRIGSSATAMMMPSTSELNHSEHLATPRRSFSSGTSTPNREFLRRVERFGVDLEDTCLFPLALPMDGSDIYKGASTWESINLLADCVLSLWTDRSCRSELQPLSRWHNPVLTNSPKHLCLQPELTDCFLLHPDSRLPFRRSVSETDLSQLGIDDTSLATNSRRMMKLTSQISHSGDSVYSMSNGLRGDEEGMEEDDEGSDRNRSRSTLTTYLAKKVTNFKEAKQRKDRFNLNLTKNMKTEARRLASRNELENPYKFAKKISKLEKRYYLSVASREFMSLVFKKGSTIRSDLEEMLNFGQELSQLIADLVCTEFTVDDQGMLIANAIETAFTLHQKANYQSFKSVMRGLQLPEVYRLKNAWKVVQQKYPLYLRVYHYLTFLVAYKVDHSTISPAATPSLPTLTAFLDLLRVRCLSIWDALEGRPHWKRGPSLVSLLMHYQISEDLIEAKVHQKLTNDLQTKLKKWYQKGPRPGKFPLKRLLHPESKTMANVLRKEAKHARIGRDTISRLKAASSLMVESDQMPITWSLRSLRHLPSLYQMPVIREFNEVYSSLIATVEAYKF